MRLFADSLACRRSTRLVFENVSFEVHGGEALAVTGPNGAGKSTLLRVLAGLLPALAGTIGLEPAADDTPLAEQCHYVGHRDALKPALTPTESLAFWRTMLGGEALAPSDALEIVGLTHAADLPSAYLSAGQRRRLAFARLLVSQRPVWLLDEPQSALDARSRERLAGLMAAHLTGGGLIIAATHDPLGVPSRSLDLGRAG
jgi:heme exporter protein A